MAVDAPQRSYRAACPGCGAPVEFLSAQSTHAVCAYCNSAVVRKGDVLSRIGKMAELFDDHSPLQLGATGTWNGRPFSLIGRLQYRYGEGTWTEWQLLFADAGQAFLSEDNGAYVLMLPSATADTSADAAQYEVGRTVTVAGMSCAVASNQSVALIAAEGELPRLPPLGRPFAMVELRSPAGEVLSLDYSCQPPALCVGSAVRLDQLALHGLREESATAETGRQLSCPNCGAPVLVALDNTKSITCGACHCIIDLSQGVGAELKHALQGEPVRPLIALGGTGQLQGSAWQVVGFQHRMGHDPADPDEHFSWDEYLLYNRQRGFTFMVDATDGWSLVRPATGAPVASSNLQSATYLGTRYQLKESYQAETNYVAGEFYWQVQRGQQTQNRDYSNGSHLLSMERSPNELTWSVGAAIDSAVVAKAFGLEGKKALLERSDVAPVSALKGLGLLTVAGLFLGILLLLLLLSRCAGCDPELDNCAASTTPRSSGGAYGGYSGGGGHK